MTLIYSDGPGKRIGLVGVTDPKAPKAAASLLRRQPTTVVLGGKALGGVNTSNRRPTLRACRNRRHPVETVESTCDIGGQPTPSPSAPTNFAVVIENERDEEISDAAIRSSAAT
jgi:hypothetical protein